MYKFHKLSAGSRAAIDYHAIEMLGQQEKHMPTYVAAMQDSAARTNAPMDAIRLEPTGNWLLVSMLEPTHPFRIAYEATYGPVKSVEGELQASL